MDQLVIIQLFITTAILIRQALSDCTDCTNNDLNSIKLVCQQKGQQLERAELTENATVVCNGLDELLTCVAEKVPQCLSTFGAQTQRYRWTPWDCHLSQSQVFKYQEIINKGCRINYLQQDVSVRPLSGDRSSRNGFKSSTNLSVNDTNSSSIPDCGLMLTVGMVCLQLIKLWPFRRFP